VPFETFQGLVKDAQNYLRTGRVDDAVGRYKRALELRPRDADTHNNLGVALVQHGRIEEAVTHYGCALDVNPEHADAHSNLGVALVRQGRLDEGAAHYRTALALRPAGADIHNNLGVLLMQQGKVEEAAAHFEQAVVLNPEHVNAHSNLGVALVQQGKIDEGIGHYSQALATDPDNAEAYNGLGVALVQIGRIDEAAAHYERALVLNPEHVNAHSNLGVARLHQGRVDEATRHCRQALEISPECSEAHNGLGNIAKLRGAFNEAMIHYDRAIAIRPGYAESHFDRAEIRTFRPGDADLTALESLAARDDLSPGKKLIAHFALAKALEDLGDYPRAFEQLRRGNELKRRRIDYDEPGALNVFASIATVFEPAVFERFHHGGDPSTVPIFVVGMPRSGGTLVEQILASHPLVQGGGELEALDEAMLSVSNEIPWPECIRPANAAVLRRMGQAYLARLPALAEKKLRLTDKLPANFQKIGLIHLILPNAKIVHTVRDPADTCVSCYSKLFTFGQEFTYDLEELGRYYAGYQTLMDHWRSCLPTGVMLDVSYEALVDDLEGEARRLIEFCGMDWDDRCVRFHETNRVVATASAVQVRKPLFRNSLQRWRKYEAELGPLLTQF
jgi:tetratricopeptide (TPR) repeat protein